MNCLSIERSSWESLPEGILNIKTRIRCEEHEDGEGVRSSRGCYPICHVAFRYTIKQVTCVAATHTLVTNHAEAQ